MSNLLDFTANVLAGRYSLRAGTTIAANDTLELGPNGKAWPIQTTDYAAVGNAASSIVAETTLRTGAAVSATALDKRWPVVQDPVTGNLIFFNTNQSGASYGVKIYRYTAGGTSIGQLILDASTFNPKSPELQFLSNGNVLFTCSTAAGAIQYAIFDVNLNIVTALTTISETAVDEKYDALAFSAGGFGITYSKTGTATQRLEIYSNTGAVTVAAATIATWGASGCVVFANAVELSNGNIAFIFSNITASALGMYRSIYTTAGVQVLANVSVEAGSVSATPSISAFGGYYAIMRYDGTSTMKVRVYTDAGVIQGAAFSVAVGGSDFGATDTFKVINDGTQFWAVYRADAIAFVQLTKIPVTGTNYVTVSTLAAATGTAAVSLDMFYERGFLICAHNLNNSSQVSNWGYFVVDTVNMTTVTVNNLFGSTPAAEARNITLIPGGDFTFVAMYDADPGSVATLFFYVGKYANSAVVGVALAAAVTDTLVSVLSAAAAYASNGVKGSASKQFDHSATNIYGNKGVLLSYGSVMKGF